MPGVCDSGLFLFRSVPPELGRVFRCQVSTCLACRTGCQDWAVLQQIDLWLYGHKHNAWQSVRTLGVHR
eukprot:6034687-Amphidinium_carterae.1